ncbi:unnamed protein product [Prorocentrum cordatum]|uniref:Metallo-beta-lactamase domain-containing protein n=1 Tax=Prorocentrum cordatum TaxID=2364126 RepID=A0ABN9RS53_9DINO|nr:unnamed protein product [Polarella glacialis]
MEERRALAPWLRPRTPPCCPRLRQLLGVAGSLALLLYLLAVGLVLLVVQLLGQLVGLLMVPALRSFGYVVEYAYSLRVCRLHVAIERFVQRRISRRPYHSRCLDLRARLDLEAGGACFVHPVPCLTNNYAYLLVDAPKGAEGERRHDKSGLRCCLVDPCDAAAVIELVEALSTGLYAAFGGLVLEAVLCTHKHWDHAGGNTELRSWAASARSRTSAARRPGGDEGTEPLAHLRYTEELRVYGGFDDSIPGRTHAVESGQRFHAAGLEFEALATPGHTAGSMAFCVRGLAGGAGAAEALFTGDCLFSGGCGAPFEGSELDMQHCFGSILQRCDPRHTLLFPGHEYTSMLLDDAVERAQSGALFEVPPGHFLSLCGDCYLVAHRRRLHDKLPTVPCTLAGELQVNPMFAALRGRADTLVEAAERLQGWQATQGQGADEPVQVLPSLGDSAAAPPPPLASAPEELGEKVKRKARPREARGAAAAAPRRAAAVERPMPVHLAVSEEAAPPPPAREEAGEPTVGAGLAHLSGREPCFAFLYRGELEELRQELRAGNLGGPEAADRLLELERRVFQAPLLTCAADAFDDDGLPDDDPLAEGATAPAVADTEQPAAAETAAPADPDAPPGTPALRREVSQALRVLGAPSAVALGRKAPCREDRIPIYPAPPDARHAAPVHRGLPPQRRGAGAERTLAAAADAAQADAAQADAAQADAAGAASAAADGAALLPLAAALDALCPLPPRRQRGTGDAAGQADQPEQPEQHEDIGAGCKYSARGAARPVPGACRVAGSAVNPRCQLVFERPPT